MVGQQLMVKEQHEVIVAIQKLEKQKKEIEAQEKVMREKLLKACEEYGVLGFDNEMMSVTYIPETTRDSVDTAALKRDYPELVPLYTKTSKVKASLRIKVK